jgi:hypothetical protein
MAHVDLPPDAPSDAWITELHRSTVTAIRHAAQQGWFTAAEARSLIDRVRTHAATLSTEGSSGDGSPT